MCLCQWYLAAILSRLCGLTLLTLLLNVYRFEHNARAFPFLGDSQEGVKRAAASWRPPCGVFLSSRMLRRHSRRNRRGAKRTVSRKILRDDQQTGCASGASWPI